MNVKQDWILKLFMVASIPAILIIIGVIIVYGELERAILGGE